MRHPETALAATEQDPPGVRPLNDPPVSVEQIPAHTLEAVTYLFPKKGLHIFTLLLGYASVKQLALPEHGLVDVAVVSLPSIEYFARRHALSKDTALRYIAMFELLGILSRRRHAEQSELHIPLVAWHPGESVLPTLDTCLNSTAREKLRQLATGVKARFLLLYGSPRTWTSLLDEIRATFTDVQEQLARRSSSQSKRFLLHQRIDRLQCRLTSLPNPSSQEGDLATLHLLHPSRAIPQKGDLAHGVYPLQSTKDIQKGDFQRTQAALRVQKGDLASPDLQQKGDFSAALTSTSPTFLAQKGDSLSPQMQQKGDLPSAQESKQIIFSAQKGDLNPTSEGGQTPFCVEKGDFQGNISASTLQKGDFQTECHADASQKGDFQVVPSSASLNDNVVTSLFIKQKENVVSDNDAPVQDTQVPSYSPAQAAKVGRQLALFLEKTPKNTGGFVNKCKQYGPKVIRAAVVDVLVHSAFPQVDVADERGRPKNRARWFHDACKKFGEPGRCIPAYVEKWLKTDCSWEEIEQQLNQAALRYQRYMISGSSSANLVRQWLRGEIEQQALEEALQASTPVLTSAHQAPTEIAVPVVTSEPCAVVPAVVSPAMPEKTWMDEADAIALANEILRDGKSLEVTSAVPQRQHGVYVVALVWRGTRMVMETPEQWRKHLVGVKEVLALRERMQQGGSHGTLQ